MSDVSTEQKIQLVQQIRTQYQRNQYDLNNRERILYGKGSDMVLPSNEESVSAPGFSAGESLKFRCALAALFLIFIIVFDLAGIHPFGIEMKQIFSYIAMDYQENVTEFVETMKSGLE